MLLTERNEKNVSFEAKFNSFLTTKVRSNFSRLLRKYKNFMNFSTAFNNNMTTAPLPTAAAFGYGFGSFVLVFLQATTNYLAMLPDTTLAGIGLLCASFSGVVSYFWQKSRGKSVKLTSQIVFSFYICAIVGLITYNSMIAERHLVTYWLALLLISGFMSQGGIILISSAFQKRAMVLLDLKSEEIIDDSQPTARKRKK